MSRIDFKGGRKAPLPEEVAPRLKVAQILSTKAKATPVIKPQVDYFSKVTDWPMYLNDRIGDCTIAGIAHMVEAFTTYGDGPTIKVTDLDVLRAYSEVSGYDPNTGAHDDGAVMQDVLNYWRKNGIAGHKILAFAEVDLNNLDECRQATELFGALYLGMNFPNTAMDQFDDGEPWDVVHGARNEGGHAIYSGWYDASTGTWKVITWGAVQEVTPEFFAKYFEEAWIVITQEWLGADGKTPEGIDGYALGEWFTALTDEPNPFPQPDPNPFPDPEPVDPTGDALAAALQRFLKTSTGQHTGYLRSAAEEWLGERS